MEILDLVFAIVAVSTLIVFIKLVISKEYTKKILCFYFIFNNFIAIILLKNKLDFDNIFNVIVIILLLQLLTLLFLANFKNQS